MTWENNIKPYPHTRHANSYSSYTRLTRSSILPLCNAYHVHTTPLFYKSIPNQSFTRPTPSTLPTNASPLLFPRVSSQHCNACNRHLLLLYLPLHLTFIDSPERRLSPVPFRNVCSCMSPVHSYLSHAHGPTAPFLIFPA